MQIASRAANGSPSDPDGEPVAGGGSRSIDAVSKERNAWLEIDLGALGHNLETLRRALEPGVEVLAVVKANAYGHGAEAIGRELERLGVERLAVAWVSEGLALRRAGVGIPIVVLGHSFAADAAAAVAADLTLTADSPELGEALSRAACAAGRISKVHIKLDTGLHRFGVDAAAAEVLAERLRGLPCLLVEGLSTHMANADEEDDSFSGEQRQRFEAAAERIGWIPFRHVANSATAMRRPELHYHGVRLGLSLYGLVPANTPSPGLEPVMSLRARVARVLTVGDGEGVSYGLTWRAKGTRQVALVPVGYGDGWRRGLTGRCSVLVRGRRAPAVGRIAMDQFLVDVSDIGEVKAGQVVTLIGRDGEEWIGADQVAAAAETISWEILAGMQARLPRIFHRGGQVEGVLEG